MLRALLLAVVLPALAHAQRGGGAQCTYHLEISTYAKLSPAYQKVPLCIDVDRLPHVPAAVVRFIPQFTQKLCVNVTLVYTKQNWTKQTCLTGSDMSLPLLPPGDVLRNYTLQILPPYASGELYVSVSAENSCGMATTSLQSMLPTYTPPTPYRACDDCDQHELSALVMCAKDAQVIGCDGYATGDDELACLDRHMSSPSELSTDCRNAMRTLNDCLNAPHLLLPMEIAAAMLLMTAMFTLVCTVLRCCCRRFCTAPLMNSSAPSVLEEQLADLSDVGSEEEDTTQQSASTAGGPSAPAGGRTGASAKGKPDKAAPMPAADEDDLPAYTQVVEHSTLTVQPLQCASSHTGAIN